MPPAAPQGGGDQSAGHMGPLWIVVGLFVLIFGVWYFGHAYIVEGYFYLKLFEISIIHFFTDALNDVRAFILSTSSSAVTFKGLMTVADAVGQYLKIPSALLLLLFAVVLFFRSSSGKFRITHTMKSLLNLEVQDWPQEMPTLRLDLGKENIEKGPWAMAKTPMQFAKRYKLLQEKKEAAAEGQLAREARITVSLIKTRANRLFTLQLGRHWQSIDALPPHVKALFAAFLAKAAHDTQGAQDFLYHMSKSSVEGQVDFLGTNALLEKHRHQPFLKELFEKHAYVFTVMASLLELARLDGVLACADFLWLKPVDRRLWFLLNCVGRQTVFTEVAGPFAHWLAEKELGHRLKTPMVDQATKALSEAIQEIRYNKDTEY